MKKLVVVLLGLLLACTSQQNQSPEPIKEYINHKVQYQGETLGLIASWYTGSSKDWKLILAENPNLDVTRMRIGEVILIPRNLVKRSEPLTRDFIAKYSAPVAPAPVEDAIEESSTTTVAVSDDAVEEEQVEVNVATDTEAEIQELSETADAAVEIESEILAPTEPAVVEAQVEQQVDATIENSQNKKIQVITGDSTITVDIADDSPEVEPNAAAQDLQMRLKAAKDARDAALDRAEKALQQLEQAPTTEVVVP